MALEDIMGRVSDLAQAGAAKAREIAEIAKLKVNNAAEQDAIRKAYLELGKLYYAERGAAPEAPYAALCDKVTASKEKIAYNKQKIADIKAANNIKDEDLPEDLAGVDTEMDVLFDEPIIPEAPSDDQPE